MKTKHFPKKKIKHVKYIIITCNYEIPRDFCHIFIPTKMVSRILFKTLKKLVIYDLKIINSP